MKKKLISFQVTRVERELRQGTKNYAPSRSKIGVELLAGTANKVTFSA